jgi:signal transduction histidine kinase
VLINDILDIAKVEAGKLEVVPENVALDRLAESLESTFQPLAMQKNLGFRLEIQPGAPALLVTDRQRVEQILKNLLSNALKFTDKRRGGAGGVGRGGRRRGLRGVRFGHRHRPQQHELIFEAFRQADGTTSRRYGGTGLGLSISRDLTQLLGGTLTVQSEPGKGSTFILQLPAVAPQAPGQQSRPPGRHRRAPSAIRRIHRPIRPPWCRPRRWRPRPRPRCRRRSSPTTARFRATRCAACW